MTLVFQYRNFKLIYRRYAGLFFVFGVDVTDNELLLMETVHLFVELLDEYFSNVCEVNNISNSLFQFSMSQLPHIIIGITNTLLFQFYFPFQLDIVFHFNKVYALLDEFILAGEVQETNKKVIIGRLKELEKIE